MEASMIQLHRHAYKNTDSAENVIRYITRTRPNENRAHELLLWGLPYGYTYLPPVEHVIHEFEHIQKHYRTSGSLMCHYTLYPSSDFLRFMNGNVIHLGNYCTECCTYLLNMGHQSCFAIHYGSNNGLHVHFAINTTNFTNGKKLRQYPKEIKRTIEVPFYEIMKKYTLCTQSILDVL